MDSEAAATGDVGDTFPLKPGMKKLAGETLWLPWTPPHPEPSRPNRTTEARVSHFERFIRR
jgi:hypothetical protein